MARRERRAQAAQDRSSPTLLRKLLAEREGELAHYREIRFSIARAQGRIRVDRRELAQMQEGDCFDIREDDDTLVVEFVKADG